MTQPTPVFLLGAGASLPAKLPLASALTGQMLDTLRDGTSAQRLLAPVLTYVVGAIVGFEAASGKDPRRLPDIESVVSTVALLRDRDNLEVTPFVDWQENVRGFERSSQPPNRLIRALEEELRGDRRSGTMSARDTAKAIAALATSIATPDRPHVYGQLHEEMVRALDTLLALRDPDATAYLAPLVTFAPKVTVATLNYDVTVEAAAERAGVSHADGTNGWSSTGLLDWQNSQVQLLKLHGSLTWRRLDTRTFAGGPAMPAEFVDARAEYHDAPFLVFGRREKLQAAGPFLQLLEEFRRRLAAVKDLVVIGYSFADPHVNVLVSQWLNADVTRRLAVVDPYYPPAYRYGGDLTYQQQLIRSLAPSDDLENSRLQRLAITRDGVAEYLAKSGNDPVEYAFKSGEAT